MPRCIMYNDPADCDKAPCGMHCNVYRQMKEDAPCDDCHGAPEVHNSCQCQFAKDTRAAIELEREVDEDPCVQCVKDQGPCGLGVRVCTCEGECPCHVPVASIGTAYDCYQCVYGTLYNCYAGRC